MRPRKMVPSPLSMSYRMRSPRNRSDPFFRLGLPTAPPLSMRARASGVAVALALEALALDERLDISKAAITGWSLGGGVALYSAWQPLKDAISSNLGFAVKLSPTQTESSPAFSTCFAISKTGWILVGRSSSNNKPLVGSNMPNFNFSLVTGTYHYNLLGIHIWYQPVKQPWFHMRI